MSSLADHVLLPARDSINTGLHSASEETMLRSFGEPGKLTPDCSEVTNARLQPMTVEESVGPFVVVGLKFAVQSLKQLLSEASRTYPEAVDELRTEGMLCCRATRKNPKSFSNHSWGTAIDLYYGGGVVPQGEPVTERGLLDLNYFFHSHGWYWGAGFSGKYVDSMQFEISEEMIRNLGAHL